MTSRWQTAMRVCARKHKYPEKYCLEPECLYRTDETYCPRHTRKIVRDAVNKAVGTLVKQA